MSQSPSSWRRLWHGLVVAIALLAGLRECLALWRARWTERRLRLS
jgi:hypothetical protein